MGSSEDVNRAAVAARQAFRTYRQTSREQRLDLLNTLLQIYKRRFDEMAQAISTERGPQSRWPVKNMHNRD